MRIVDDQEAKAPRRRIIHEKKLRKMGLCRTEQRTTALSAILRVSTVGNAAAGNGRELRITRQSLIEQTEESSR